MLTAAPYLRVLALARTGALDIAWRELKGAAPEGQVDPTRLNLMGRVLKEFARRETGEDRRRLFREAAASYEASWIAQPASYPLVNAATLSLLAGDSIQAAQYARELLTALDLHPDEPETPYWRVATRAEALLLLDRDADARAAFAEAVALAPDAWEDRASTLRQFRLILAEQGRDASWLDAYRPPRSVFFGGHMSFDARVGRRAHLDDRIAAVLEEEKVGFGYGALAAGADILVAEALVARGAELHAVLPGGAEAFAARSVEPFGRGWRRRFDALLAAAATVRAVRPIGLPDPEMIALGDEIGLGAAAMNARGLESEAFRLLVAPEGEWEGPGSRWRLRLLPAPRETARPAPAPVVVPHRRLALLAAAVDPATNPAATLAQLAEAVAAGSPPSLAPWFTGREVLFGYAAAADAARAARALTDAGARMGGHYGIAAPFADPFGGGRRVAGEVAELAAAASASAPAGAACITGDFAAAVAASAVSDLRTELVGELAGGAGAPPAELYALL